MKKAALFFVAAALVALGLAGCGGGGGSSSGGADTTAASTSGGSGGGASAGTLKIEADPNGNLAFTSTSLTAKAGNVTVDFSNPSAVGHDVVVEDSSGQEVGKTKIITGSDASFSADLKPGTYTFFCSVPGHEDAGMKGTITVS